MCNGMLMESLTAVSTQAAMQPATTTRAAVPAWTARVALVMLVCWAAHASAGQHDGVAGLGLFPGNMSAGGGQAVSFRQSQDLGVARCSLLGVINDVDVILHVWLRVVPPASAPLPPMCSGAAPGTAGCGPAALVRGVAFLQDHRRSVPYASPMIQMVQSSQIARFAGQMTLRSTVSGHSYPLHVRVPARGPSVRLFPNMRKANATNHVIDITGRLELQEQDQHGMLDLELRVEGFQWHCNVLVQPPVLRQQPTPPVSRGPDAPERESVSSNVQHVPLRPWKHLERASLTNETQVWVLLAPFHGVSLRDYSLTLWYHVLWHQVMGVTRYLLYVTERLGALLDQPIIQALMRRDLLEVVLFTEMSKHEHAPFKPDLRDKYAMQVLQINHAMLALWGSDTLCLLVDLDEYLVTSSPSMGVVQAYQGCGAEQQQDTEGTPLAGVQVHRYDATCRKNATLTQCDPNIPNNQLWLAGDIQQVVSGAAPHPLTSVTFQLKVPFRQWDQKPILDPGLAWDVHVHDFAPSPGSVSRNVTGTCARLLHLLDFYGIRHRGKGRPPGEPDEDMRPWLWPADKLEFQQGLGQA